MLRKEKPERDGRPRDPPYPDADTGTWQGDPPHPIETQLSALRQMAAQLEREVDEILIEAGRIAGSASAATRSEVIKALTASKRKKLIRLQSYLALLEEQARRSPAS